MLKLHRQKLESREGKHRKVCIYWEEHWAGCPGTQSLVWLLPLSTSVALIHGSDFLGIDFLSFMIGILIPFLPTSEALGASKEIEWNVYMKVH